MTHTKVAQATIKAVGPADDPDLKAGQFRALVSVFSNVDSHGDIVIPGAFLESIADYEAREVPIPVVWSHDWADPFHNIGHTVSARETDEGLEIVGQLDVKSPVTRAAETAQQVHRLLSERRVTQFSFAYDVIESDEGNHEYVDSRTGFNRSRTVTYLRKLRLLEVGPCLVGVNRETELLDVKHDVRARATIDATTVLLMADIIEAG